MPALQPLESLRAFLQEALIEEELSFSTNRHSEQHETHALEGRIEYHIVRTITTNNMFNILLLL